MSASWEGLSEKTIGKLRWTRTLTRTFYQSLSAMFLQLAHTKTPVFLESKKLTLKCYRITKDFPMEEKFAMVQQIRRAALSVHLNIAEGCSKKSGAERKRFFEACRRSVIEIHPSILRMN